MSSVLTVSIWGMRGNFNLRVSLSAPLARCFKAMRAGVYSLRECGRMGE